MKRIGIIAAVLLAVAVTIGFFLKRGSAEEVTYRFVEVTRGDVESSVSATGKLSAVRTVQVGTQVSGQIAGIYVDFNDQVKKGQVIARLDPTVLQQQVRSAEVDMERARADVAQKKYELDQSTPLFQQKVITETEYNTAKYNHAMAQSSLKSAQVSYERAKQNLDYATIYAPIDGIVVERNVEPGQTVAASMSTPQIFLLAEDLKNMQILVNVDESDIGSIREGMPAHFNVQAYPDRTFEGRVEQVRLQSAATENVVNYTVVVRVNNLDGVLLPGMTATVAFEVQKVNNVMKVPAAALRFRPTEDMLAAVGLDSASRAKRLDSLKAAGVATDDRGTAGASAQRGAQTAQGADAASTQPGFGPGAGRAGGNMLGMGGRTGGGMLWYKDETGKLQILRVKTGLTNGQETEITGAGLKEGMQIIAGVSGGDAAEAANPFQGQQQQGRGGFRGGF